MWSDHAFSNDARPSPALMLAVVYAVDADATFDAMKLPTVDRRKAAIRTTGGEGELYLATGDPLPLRAGTLLMVDFNLVRRYRPTSGAWRFWYFEFACDTELDIPSGIPLPLPDPARDEEDCRECLEILRRPGAEHAAWASAIFGVLVSRWLAAWVAGTQVRHPRENRIREAVARMRRHLDEPLSVPAMARTHGMSERTFRDAFEAVMDSPPKRYFDRLRLEKCAELLRTNRYSIRQIADQLGYSSAFHLSRAFRDLFGVPPSRYASVIRNESRRAPRR